MIGILIVSHGSLGQSLTDCAEHVFGGPIPGLRAVNVHHSDDPAQLVRRLGGLVRELDSGAGVLILADIFGATPSNVVCRLLQPGRVEAIAGVNVPMLLRALQYREQELGILLDKALSGGRDGVLHIGTEVCHAG